MNSFDDRLQNVEGFLGRVFGDDLHVKRVESLAHGVLGVMAGASLAVSIIGLSMAQARGVVAKHAIKQVDRLLSNEGIVVWDAFAPWVRMAVGARKSIVVAMDWTDFDKDDQTTLAINLVGDGRATPLLWLTVFKGQLKDDRNDIEDFCLDRLAQTVPEGVEVMVLADRGFGDAKLFTHLKTLGFSYAIRIRGNIYVTAADGEKRLAVDWVGKGGRAKMLRGAQVTAAQCPVGAVVCVHAKGMKEPWCIVTSEGEATAGKIINLYSRRWTIEPNFRDTKDIRFGMGMSVLRIADPNRRDRLLLLSAMAIMLLTLLGTAGESLGMDRQLKSNTSKTRTHSLFRQGCMLYYLMPNMPEHRLRPLVERYAELIRQNDPFMTAFSANKL